MAALMVLPMSVSARKKDSAIKVISYNIRLGTANDGDNSWEFRYPASSMMINDQKPDIFGLQEAYDFQVNYLEGQSAEVSGDPGINCFRQHPVTFPVGMDGIRNMPRIWI